MTAGEFFARFSVVTPSIAFPEQRLQFAERLTWSFIGCVVVQCLTLTPSFGGNELIHDPLGSVRQLIGSSIGALAPLGLLPLIASCAVTEVLQNSGLLKGLAVNETEAARIVSRGASIAFSIAGLALLTVVTLLDSQLNVSLMSVLVLLIQWIPGTLLVQVVDDMFGSGYGIAHGLSTLVAYQFSTTLFESLFGIIRTVAGPDGELQLSGAVPSFFHLLVARTNKLHAFAGAAFRSEGYNLVNVAVTLAIFAGVMYAQNMFVDVGVSHQRMRGVVQQYPIKALAIPVIPVAMVASVLGYTVLAGEAIVSILGAVRGLSYVSSLSRFVLSFIEPPAGISTVMFRPWSAASYTAAMLVGFLVMGRYFPDLMGNNSKSIARHMKDQQLTIKGFRDTSLVGLLERFLPSVTSFTAIATALIVSVGDILGSLGGTAGLLISIPLVSNLIGSLTREGRQMM